MKVSMRACDGFGWLAVALMAAVFPLVAFGVRFWGAGSSWVLCFHGTSGPTDAALGGRAGEGAYRHLETDVSPYLGRVECVFRNDEALLWSETVQVVPTELGLICAAIAGAAAAMAIVRARAVS